MVGAGFTGKSVTVSRRSSVLMADSGPTVVIRGQERCPVLGTEKHIHDFRSIRHLSDTLPGRIQDVQHMGFQVA